MSPKPHSKGSSHLRWTPREHVEAAIRRGVDDECPLTFRVEEDRCSVVAAFKLDGQTYTHSWAKWRLRAPEPMADQYADEEFRKLLAKANAGRPFVKVTVFKNPWVER